MPLSDQANEVAGAIDDDGKEIHDIAAENAHVERVCLSEGGEGSLKGNGGAAFERQP